MAIIDINSGLIANLGLLLGIIGAFFLAESFILKRIARVVKESSTYFNGNPFLLYSNIVQRIEARTGFGFLAFGFFLQFVANTSPVRQGQSSYLWILLGMVIGAVAFGLVRVVSRKRARREVAKQFGEGMIKALEDLKRSGDAARLKDLVKHYGDALNFSNGNKDVHMYTERIVKYVKSIVEPEAKRLRNT